MSKKMAGTKDVRPENITLGEATATSPELVKYLIGEIGHDDYLRLPNHLTLAQISDRLGVSISTLIGRLNR